jgi:molybdenum cofactor cytidylyltransferase
LGSLSIPYNKEVEDISEQVRSRNDTTAAVILAAGLGERFQGATHKLLAPFRGKPVLQWVIEAASAAEFDDIYLISGAIDFTEEKDLKLSDHGVTIVENHNFEDGQATSLRSAIAIAEHDNHSAIVVGLGDMPLVPASAWRSVASSDGKLVVATFTGNQRPPVKIHHELWPLVPISGDEGAKSLLRLRPDLIDEIVCEGNPIDIDTRGDLERWN